MRHALLKLRPLLLVTMLGCPAGLEPPVAQIRAGSSVSAGRDGVCDEELTTLSAELGAAVQLHAACSHDPNGLDLSFQWAVVDQPNGSLLEIPNPTVVSPTVVPDIAGRYRLSLIVTNGTLSSPRAYVVLNAE